MPLCAIFVSFYQQSLKRKLAFFSRFQKLVPVSKSKHLAWVRPPWRGGGGRHLTPGDANEPSPVERRAGTIWAQRRQRIFCIDFGICLADGSTLRDIVWTDDATMVAENPHAPV